LFEARGRRYFWVAALILLMTLSQGAQRSVAALRPATGADRQPTGADSVVIDEVGRQIKIPAKVNRVVTLAPDLTETIYALGLEGRLAGDTNYCDTPPAAKLKPHIGAPLNPSLEAIVALHPDLVLASTSINRRETVDALARLGVAVYASDPHTVRGMLASVQRISDLMDASAQGDELVAPLQARLDALRGRLSELPLAHVLFVVWQDPLISIGQRTFIADALRWAGAESVILSRQNWPHISLEEVVRLQPDYIVFTSNHTGAGVTQLEDLRARAGWKSLRAVELGQVLVVSDELARPSPGMIDAIEQLARELHPGAFSPQGIKQSFEGTGREHASRVIALRNVAQTGTEEGCVSCVR
jgi:iron complex transport system substrate-binding protein